MADAVMHTIHQADLLAHLRGNRWLVQNGYIPKSHAILCDPPYGLAFMGKEWDTLGAVEFQAWVTEWAGLLIDYVHPGALGLFFGGTRTYHRLAAGLEDAGWEITDCIMWVTGQGFPKSASIGKLLDKEAGAAREVVGTAITGAAYTRAERRNANEGFESGQVLRNVTAPATPLAARWEGYGTALKPSFEPCVVCRAPRGKRTYAALAREFGTGALAIDAARIGTDAITTNGWGVSRQAVYNAGSGLFSRDTLDYRGGDHAGRWPANFALVCTCESDDHAADCPTVRLGDEARFFYQAKAARWERSAGLTGNQSFGRESTPNAPLTRKQCSICGCTSTGGDHTGHAPGQMTCGHPKSAIIHVKYDPDSYHAKQPVFNHHPTVKPIRLAEYLARLILPPAGDEPRRLLVPFAGSGSEMIGALLAGWDVVTGIEREAEYVDLARARVGWWAQFATYDEARAAHEQERKAKPAPVVIDEKPYTLPMLIMEQVCTSANA
jgi:hypothetical protein